MPVHELYLMMEHAIQFEIHTVQHQFIVWKQPCVKRFLQPKIVYRMPFSGMLRHEALVRTDVLEEHNTSIIWVTRIGDLGMLAVTSN
jgi:hypothetical protein